MSHYIIRGGLPGRQRLRLLARVMKDATGSLLDRVFIQAGLACLDVGCGGGDVTLELARRTGPHGRVIGEDVDAVKLDLAREEAATLGFPNVEFRCVDVFDAPSVAEFDLIYVRFLLTHLPDPLGALKKLVRRLRKGGVLVIEDIDFSGHVCYPEHPAFRLYHDLHIQSMQRRGGNANIGPTLPGLLRAVGLQRIEMNIVQPMGMTGEVKLVPAVTMENIAEVVIADGLTTAEELDRVIHDLYELAHDERTVTGMPRIFQTWGSITT